MLCASVGCANSTILLMFVCYCFRSGFEWQKTVFGDWFCCFGMVELSLSHYVSLSMTITQPEICRKYASMRVERYMRTALHSKWIMCVVDKIKWAFCISWALKQTYELEKKCIPATAACERTYLNAMPCQANPKRFGSSYSISRINLGYSNHVESTL